MKRIAFVMFIDEEKPMLEWFSKMKYCNENQSFEEEGPFSYITDITDKLRVSLLSKSAFNLFLNKVLEIGYDFELIVLENNLECWCIEKVGKMVSLEYVTLSLCGGIWTKMFKRILVQSDKKRELNYILDILNCLGKKRAKFIFHRKISNEYLLGFLDKDKNLVVYLIAKEGPGKLPLGMLSDLVRISEEKRLKNGIFQFTNHIVRIS